MNNDLVIRKGLLLLALFVIVMPEAAVQEGKIRLGMLFRAG